MLSLKIKSNLQLQQLISKQDFDLSLNTRSPEEKVILLILRDLLRLDWQVNFKANRVTLSPPEKYDKDIIKESMQIKRQEKIQKNSIWLKNHLYLAQANLA